MKHLIKLSKLEIHGIVDKMSYLGFSKDYKCCVHILFYYLLVIN